MSADQVTVEVTFEERWMRTHTCTIDRRDFAEWAKKPIEQASPEDLLAFVKAGDDVPDADWHPRTTPGSLNGDEFLGAEPTEVEVKR